MYAPRLHGGLRHHAHATGAKLPCVLVRELQRHLVVVADRAGIDRRWLSLALKYSSTAFLSQSLTTQASPDFSATRARPLSSRPMQSSMACRSEAVDSGRRDVGALLVGGFNRAAQRSGVAGHYVRSRDVDVVANPVGSLHTFGLRSNERDPHIAGAGIARRCRSGQVAARHHGDVLP